MSDSWAQFIGYFSEVEELRGAEMIRELPGGPASSSFLLAVDGQRLVARVDRPAAQVLKLDRQSEIKVLQTVSTAGIGPKPVWADPQQGLLVCTYIEGSACSHEQLTDPELLQELASTIRRLHSLPTAGPEFKPKSAVRNYAEKLATPTAQRLADRAGTLLTQLRQESGPRVLCHNDLVHSNIINNQPMRLIDWEYAAVGNPFFDLAVVVRHHELSASLTKGFLQAYFGGLLPEQLEKLELYGMLYDHLAGLWYLSMEDSFGLTPRFDQELQRVLTRLSQYD